MWRLHGKTADRNKSKAEYPRRTARTAALVAVEVRNGLSARPPALRPFPCRTIPPLSNRTTCHGAQSKGFRATSENRNPPDALEQQGCRLESPPPLQPAVAGFCWAKSRVAGHIEEQSPPVHAGGFFQSKLYPASRFGLAPRTAIDGFMQILSVRRLQRNAGHHDSAIRARHKTDRPAGCTVPVTSGLDQFRKRHVFLPQSDDKTGAAQLFPEGGPQFLCRSRSRPLFVVILLVVLFLSFL
jgi:hypothetical protein